MPQHSTTQHTQGVPFFCKAYSQRSEGGGHYIKKERVWGERRGKSNLLNLCIGDRVHPPDYRSKVKGQCFPYVYRSVAFVLVPFRRLPYIFVPFRSVTHIQEREIEKRRRDLKNKFLVESGSNRRSKENKSGLVSGE